MKERYQTKILSQIPILPVAQAILDKYKYHPLTKHGELLPKITNQRYNGYLKEIADCCGIKKKLTTHTGRHTFCTTICAENGVPIETCSAMVGHARISTTQRYYRMKKRRISEDMTRLQERLSIRKTKTEVTQVKLAK